MRSRISSFISLLLAAVTNTVLAGEVTINARGNCGSEVMVLEVNGSNVANFSNISTSADSYTWSGYTGGTIRVKLTNDSAGDCDRNLFVESVEVCGSILQTETAASRIGCGDPQWLWCNGYFDFGNPGCNLSGGPEGLIVRARGNCGTETMVLEVDGSDVATFTNVSTTITDYAWRPYRGGNVKVKFINDAGGSCDRSLYVEQVFACGNEFATESTAIRAGCGDAQWLWCNGSFDFGNSSCDSGSNRTIEAGPEEMSLKPIEESFFRLYPNPASSTLFIEASDVYDVYVYSMEGQLMLKQHTDNDKSTLDVSTFKKGVYLFIVNDGNRVIVEKIDVK